MKEQEKMVNVGFRCTSDQYKKLKKKAHLNEQNISQYIRLKTIES